MPDKIHDAVLNTFLLHFNSHYYGLPSANEGDFSGSFLVQWFLTQVVFFKLYDEIVSTVVKSCCKYKLVE